MSSEIKVHGLYAHYIKSTAVNELHEAELTEKGIKFDRHWVIVKKGEDDIYDFISIDKYPKMVTIKSQIDGENLKVSLPIQESPFIIPITDEGEKNTVRIRKRMYKEVYDGKFISDAFSDYLGVKCFLMHLPEDFTSLEEWKSGENYDSYNLNVGFLESFDLVNYWITGEDGDDPVTLDRYRMNIVFKGGEPFIEDKIALVRMGRVIVRFFGGRPRCVKTTIDENGIKRGNQPLTAISRHRTSYDGALFADKAANENNGIIYEGQSVEILEYKDPPKFKARKMRG